MKLSHNSLLLATALVTCLTLSLRAGETTDLAGKWKFALDPQDLGIRQNPEHWRFPDTIRLPGMVSAQGFGEIPSFETKWTGDGWRYPDLFKEYQAKDNFKFPFFLQPPRYYVGPAWFQREIDIPGNAPGNHTILSLERVHWHSTVWVDGKEVGKGDSLGTPHEFDLGTPAPGKHTLTLRIDNRMGDVNVGPLSHSMTDHTQGNWNGAVGKLVLRSVPALRLAEVRTDPSYEGKSVKLTVRTDTDGSGKITVMLKSSGPAHDGFKSKAYSANLSGGKAEIVIPMGKEAKAWDEFHPYLYEASVVLDSPAGKDTRAVTFGFRDPGHMNGRLALNGHPIFLRGTLECCIFPLTGHPPTDVESWKRIIRICKAHGLNHIRFHSWCPPEAAFIAADEAGFYYEVECSSWANQGAEVGSGRPLDEWLKEESARMVRSYGNHPSFLMMAYGNEPAGKNHPAWLQQFVADWKSKDARRFYTTGSGWPIRPGSDYHSSPNPRIQGWGQGLKSIINSQPPRTDFDWSDFVKSHSDAPVVSHEIGQWCVYPDFKEIAKYTGHVKARNFEIFRELAKRNGLLPQADDFLMASGKLQTLCYKHDIEAALRTPGFGGFQLLDLHDFPGQGTALVGVLSPFWTSKGYVTPAEFASFCGPVVPLAKLKKMVFTNDETLDADLELAQFGPVDLKSFVPIWKLSDGTRVIAKGQLPSRDLAAGALHELGPIRVPLVSVTSPVKLKLTVGAAGGGFSNSWNVFVYPSSEPAPAHDIIVAKSLDSALSALAAGKRVLWMAAGTVADDPARPLVAGFSPIFWNTAWTKWQPPHTLGILCDPRHPAFASFPTDSHSNWQWWEIQRGARPFILTRHHGLKPIVQVIDDWVTSRKLGYVFEAKVGAGKLLACSADLETDLPKRPAARQLRASLLHYLCSSACKPSVVMTPADLGELVAQGPPSSAR